MTTQLPDIPQIKALYSGYEEWINEAFPFCIMNLSNGVIELLKVSRPELIEQEWFWLKRKRVDAHSSVYWINKEEVMLRYDATLYSNKLYLVTKNKEEEHEVVIITKEDY